MEICIEQPIRDQVYTKSTQKVVEILEKNCFEISRKGNVYHCIRPGCEEIKFRENFAGTGQIFQVGKNYCHTVNKAVDLAVPK
ncbi:MAG: hypothetical protein CVU92_04705 [Firmicutes bacterium HGW-Firmicutes-17]|jgi:hypothetical protein|nr:MAG: hypothetical protein CVU92_04705 [Firmicutes bacterium HGW-Firmicutes-17]